jgi:hypothetical protein
MFEGQKTSLFWIGLLIVSLACVALFSVCWSLVGYLYDQYPSGIPSYAVSSDVPIIVGAVVFGLVGFYMMRSGTQKMPNPQLK